MRKRRNTAAALVAVVLAALAAAPAPAENPAVKERVEFNKLVQQRNRLHAKLTTLDEQAAKLMMNGEKPLVVHADQVSVQDQLDLVELRLTILAARNGFEVPPLPGRDPLPEGSAANIGDVSNEKIAGAFARGRDRGLEQLKADGRRLLASLDFKAFLAE